MLRRPIETAAVHGRSVAFERSKPNDSLSAATIKALRDEIGATMMECKRALQETNGDYDAAKKLLLGDDDLDELESVE